MEKKENTILTVNEYAEYIMQNWYMQNNYKPYPTDQEMLYLAAHGGISIKQVKVWMANKRILQWLYASDVDSLLKAALKS